MSSKPVLSSWTIATSSGDGLRLVVGESRWRLLATDSPSKLAETHKLWVAVSLYLAVVFQPVVVRNAESVLARWLRWCFMLEIGRMWIDRIVVEVECVSMSDPSLRPSALQLPWSCSVTVFFEEVLTLYTKTKRYWGRGGRMRIHEC